MIFLVRLHGLLPCMDVKTVRLRKCAVVLSSQSYALWTSLLKVGPATTPMTILENNCMQSTASSAGYSTGGTLISAFAVYIIINHQSMSVPLMLAWVFFIAVLGGTMAIPMKRQMINIEQLRFPSGIAAAETLRALHAKSSQGLRAANALGLAALIAAAMQKAALRPPCFFPVPTGSVDGITAGRHQHGRGTCRRHAHSLAAPPSTCAAIRHAFEHAGAARRADSLPLPFQVWISELVECLSAR
jgi:hypothetical protein